MINFHFMTAEQYDAALPVWDGKSINGRYQYDPERVEYWDMRQDTDGTVYYLDWGSPRSVNVWCGAARLDAHMHHLEQIKARRA